MYAKSPRILHCTVRELILLGVKVYFNDAGWFGVLMDFIIINPLWRKFYFENIKLSNYHFDENWRRE